MRPQAEARVIRSAEVAPTSFGPLAEYRRMTGEDGLPGFSPGCRPARPVAIRDPAALASLC